MMAEDSRVWCWWVFEKQCGENYRVRGYRRSKTLMVYS